MGKTKEILKDNHFHMIEGKKIDPQYTNEKCVLVGHGQSYRYGKVNQMQDEDSFHSRKINLAKLFIKSTLHMTQDWIWKKVSSKQVKKVIQTQGHAENTAIILA